MCFVRKLLCPDREKIGVSTFVTAKNERAEDSHTMVSPDPSLPFAAQPFQSTFLTEVRTTIDTVLRRRMPCAKRAGKIGWELLITNLNPEESSV